MKSICGLAVLLCFPLTLFLTPLREDSSSSEKILIRKDRPSVYIEFARQGKAMPLFPGETEERVWLNLHNNTPWTIRFCSLPVPGPLGDVRVVYNVKHVSATMGTVGFSNSPMLQQTIKPVPAIPSGYTTGDACTPYSIASGRSATFSVPRDHLANELSIEIEFWYDWENRDNELGEYPECFVSFESSRLPRDNDGAKAPH